MPRTYYVLATLLNFPSAQIAAGAVLDTEKRARGSKTFLGTGIRYHHGLNSRWVYLEECSCGCCETQRRNPSEIETFDAVLKCSRSLSQCTDQDQCRSPHNPILASNTHAPLIYDQFCHINCQPFDDEVSGPCVRLSHREEDKARTKDGNGEDLHLEPQSPEVLPPQSPDADPPSEKEVPCEDRDPCIFRRLAREQEKARKAMEAAQAVAKQAQAQANSA